MIQDLEISRRGENNLGQRSLKEHEKTHKRKLPPLSLPRIGGSKHEDIRITERATVAIHTEAPGKYALIFYLKNAGTLKHMTPRKPPASPEYWT